MHKLPFPGSDCIRIAFHYVSGSSNAGFNRMRFLIESLKDLDNSLKNHGGRLYVFFGDPVKVFENLFEVGFHICSVL